MTTKKSEAEARLSTPASILLSEALKLIEPSKLTVSLRAKDRIGAK